MLFQRIYEEGLAQASFLVGCSRAKAAWVVDPRRDIDVYLQAAAAAGVRIAAVLETHIHADYLSGARELAAATGAVLGVSAAGGEGWTYGGLDGLTATLLTDGDVGIIGDVRVQALHTPGHTPEHLCYLVTDTADPTRAPLLLTGDFVFVGDVGRPDLLEAAVGVQGAAAVGAQQLYKSLQEQFLALPDATEVWPGHGPGSACGKSLGSAPSTTVGAERATAWWAPFLGANDETGFVRTVLAGQPAVPAYFARMKRLNRDGMPLLGTPPQPPLLSPAALTQAVAQGAFVVDTRPKAAFAAGHLPGAFSIPAGKKLATWAGMLLPPDRPLVLVAEEPAEVVRALARVGLEQVIGYLPDLTGYLAPPERTVLREVEAAEALRLWAQGEVTVLDVRDPAEFAAGHVPGAHNVPVARLQALVAEIPQDRPVLVTCAGGDRACIASGVLLQAGLPAVLTLPGGMRAWEQAGQPVVKEEP